MTNDKVPQQDPGQWRIQELSLVVAHGERVEREPITGVWGQSPQRGPGAEPLVGGLGGRSPLKLKAFELSSIQWKRQNALFSLLCNHNKLLNPNQTCL